MSENISDIVVDILATHKNWVSKYSKIVDKLKVLQEKLSPKKIRFLDDVISESICKYTSIKSLVNIDTKIIDLTSRQSEEMLMHLVSTNMDHVREKEMYVRDMMMSVSNSRPKKIVCSHCKKSNFEIKSDTVYICRECGNQRDIICLSSKYKDSSRINSSNKYVYKREAHFRDCIIQYQGKQNICIPSELLDDVRAKLAMYKMCSHHPSGDPDFSSVSRNNIACVLKDLDKSEYLENITMIHSVVSGVKPDDISHLEETLQRDFEILNDMYDRKFRHTNRTDRTSFINTQYVLFQLLRRHGHKCSADDFNILKTIDRKYIHEDIIIELFNELGWKYTSIF